MSPEPLAIILAAGKGKRMASDLPKVLVRVCGRPMIRYVIDAVRAAGIPRIVVVVGYRGDEVRRELAGEPGVEFVEQKEQLGTGHAVMQCRRQLESCDGPVLVLAGDSPMVQASSLKTLLGKFVGENPNYLPPACLLGTATKANPQGLGRILRGNVHGQFIGIVEEKDATPEQLAITEVNMSTYIFRAPGLLWALEQLTADNAAGEYYLTDCPRILGPRRVDALNVLQPIEALSINTPEELAAVEVEMSKVRR